MNVVSDKLTSLLFDQRPELLVLSRWVDFGDRVLDLGCGNGVLLRYLQKQKAVRGYGLEIDEDNILECIQSGINVIEQDLNQGLHNFSDLSFDVVVMTQALQAVRYPERILDEMLRVGRTCVVTFPNFGYWKIRMQLAVFGKMPVSKALPFSWYDTPNIHLCSFKDFESLCLHKKISILHRCVVDHAYQDSLVLRLWPNFFGEIAIYHITKC